MREELIGDGVRGLPDENMKSHSVVWANCDASATSMQDSCLSGEKKEGSEEKGKTGTGRQ